MTIKERTRKLAVGCSFVFIESELLLVFSKENISYVLGRDFILGSSKRNEDSQMTMTIKVNYQKTFQEVVKADKLATK